MLKIINHGEVFEIRVARTFLGRPVYYNSFYYVDRLLIDTGPHHLSGKIINCLSALPIDRVVITHQHEDHTGNSRLLQERFNLPVYAHPLTLEVMARPPRVQLYRKFMWGNQPPVLGRPLPESINTGEYSFHVIHTPGHSPDHVSFFEPRRRWLFCGDVYLGQKLTSFMEGENFAEHLATLEKLISLKPDILFCGLKGMLMNATDRLAQKLSFWHELQQKAGKLQEAGLTTGQIRRKLLGGEVPFYYLSQFNWGRRFLVESMLSNRSYVD